MTLTYLWLLAATALASETNTAAAADSSTEASEDAGTDSSVAVQESDNPFVQDANEPKKKGGGGGLIPVAGLFGFVFCGFCAWKRYQRGIVGLNAPTSPKNAPKEAGDRSLVDNAATGLSPPPDV